MAEKRIVPRSLGLAIVLALVLSAGCTREPAKAPPQPTRDANVESTLEAQLEAMNPAAVLLYREATATYTAGNLEEAAALYERLLVMAPGFSTAYRRLGYIALRENHTQRAEELTRKALELEQHPYNQTALAMVLLSKGTPRDSQEAFELATSAVGLLPDDEAANMALLVSAATVNNLEVARRARDRLLHLAPADPLVNFYAGLLAAQEGEWEESEYRLLRARDLGIAAADVQDVLDKGIARNALLARLLRGGGIAAMGWLVGLGLLFAGGSLLSRITIRSIERAQPSIQVPARPEERRIRSMYRAIIVVLSFYFYVSIPFVVLLLILVVGAAFYAFLSMGSFPVQLVGVLLVMLLASLVAIVRTLLWRPRAAPIGRPLRRADAPELWELAEEVAHRVGARPVDAIVVTPGAEIAVNEKGTLLQKLRGRGDRNLILGMAMVSGLSRGQLAAILAHEYGHFSNQDTAGGDLTHRVYGSLRGMADRLIQGRAAHIFNPAWLFVVAYERIFLRITMGASRLQEVLADRCAAMAYGSHNFADGLRGVIYQSIAFPLLANDVLRTSAESRQPILNLYVSSMGQGREGEVHQQCEEAMRRPSSPYDSHPAPSERISWVERLAVPDSSMPAAALSALSLFPNAEELQRAMTTQLLQRIRNQALPKGGRPGRA